MVLIFDLDDTLYDEMTYVRSGLRAVAYFGERNFGWDSNQSFTFMVRHLEKDGRGRIFDSWLAGNGALTKKRVTDCIKIYRHHDPKIKLTSEAEQLLKRYEHSFRMYLVTDGHKVVQQKKIEALGIDRFFRRMFITHRYGIHHAKPSLYCFELIRRIEKVDWKDMVYVGDNPAKDFVNLNSVGALTIRVSTGSHAAVKAHKEYDARVTIPTLSSLPKVMDQWCQ